MQGFKKGDKVRVKEQHSSPFRGKIGTVVRTYVYGLAIIYEVSFNQFLTHLSPASRSYRFAEYDLEPVG